ncbi:hypothetical protein DFQ27_009407 [Actinomortierella ambigua]|uniref:Uncharacterized protein n=1 Tax=Actinomortierella ambigua TaxID=1343610 RepID=A0A9P6UAY5_9FUNG|nr:hypothetical protein DFQ27_009407 [Actinomortierella ambigua]
MPRRPSTPANLAQPRRKSPRTTRNTVANVADAQPEDAADTPTNEPDPQQSMLALTTFNHQPRMAQSIDQQTAVKNQAWSVTSLEAIAATVFGPTVRSIRFKAAEFIMLVGSDAPPEESLIDFIKRSHPETAEKVLALALAKTREFFGSQYNAQFATIQNIVDVAKVVAYFNGTPVVDSVEEGTNGEGSSDSSAVQQLSFGPTNSSRSSNSKSSSSNGSNSTNTSLSPSMIWRMRSTFEANWSSYVGKDWTLRSGTNVDHLLRHYIVGLDYEVGLHSFIISDVGEVTELVTDSSDREQLMSMLGQERDEAAWKLTSSEMKHLDRYHRPRIALEEVLKNGYGSVMAEAAKDPDANLPDETFCDDVHDIVKRYHRVYRRNLWLLPDGKSESWYRDNIWWILDDLFNEPATIIYEHGEYHSKASGDRKNGKRKASTEHQQVDRKTDGIILCHEPSLELGVMEAAEADDGAHTIKAVSDTIKLGKVMKDQLDMLRRNVADPEIAEKLVTYGMRIAKRSVTFYTLAHLEGRWYKFTDQGTATLPHGWHQDGRNMLKLLTVISALMAFKRQVADMAANIEQWTVSAYTLPKPAGSSCRTVAPTLTTPKSSPRSSPTARASLPPPLVL